jgi:hypothetical protein
MESDVYQFLKLDNIYHNFFQRRFLELEEITLKE